MAKKTKSGTTPLMEQYEKMKLKYPDALMLFRMGDFYETFGEDAIKTSKILGITLTKRSNGAASKTELAGFPYHALDTYLPKLVRAGLRVAICEQLEDPKKTKKLVKRGIIEIVTPGLSYNDSTIENSKNNWLASVFINNNTAGLSLLDLSTGEFLAAQGEIGKIDKLLNNFQPKEVLIQKNQLNIYYEYFGKNFYTYPIDDWMFNLSASRDRLLQHFNTLSLKGFGIEKLDSAIASSGAIMQYLDLTKHSSINHITSISKIEDSEYVWLDRFTMRNLELLSTPHAEGCSLMQVLDKTVTPMGTRMLSRWLALPLKNLETINKRLSIVETLFNNESLRYDISDYLSSVGDLERLTSKIAIMRVNPRELLQLQTALDCIPSLKKVLAKSGNKNLENLSEELDSCTELNNKIQSNLLTSAPAQVSKGGVIAFGVNDELDELRSISTNGKDMLLKMQQEEAEKTGITNLKIGFNNVFGYYIEVTKSHSSKVPESWIRKQTLVNAERYITPDLKTYEDKILGAEEKILELETKLYNELVLFAGDYINTLQLDANILSNIDCLGSFAKVSIENKYTRPLVDDSNIIDIKAGRHPVIEKQLPIGEEYISNDVFLDKEEQQIMIITGPNMSGKSALLRQVALISIMAQAGCFVPAESAHLGYLDKIFTRVGASDNISLGESTFMVEMNEASNILNNLSDRSLVLFDELGRGTSTYDGISIAWAIVEYIHQQKKKRAMTLFATHYHELNEMEKSFNKIKNYNVSVKEIDNQIVFLRKLVSGGSNHSFGIQVAKMAGMPSPVIKRSTSILKQLETNNNDSIAKPLSKDNSQEDGMQLSFFQLDDPVLSSIRDELKNLQIDSLTPLEALNKLNEIKKLSGI